MKIYSVFDLKAASYGPLVAYQTDGEAARALSLMLKEKGTSLSEFPGDFNLTQVGEWDPQTGQLSGGDPRVVCNLAALVG